MSESSRIRTESKEGNKREDFALRSLTGAKPSLNTAAEAEIKKKEEDEESERSREKNRVDAGAEYEMNESY